MPAKQAVPPNPPDHLTPFFNHPVAPLVWAMRGLTEQLCSPYPPAKAVAGELQLLALRLMAMAQPGGPLANVPPITGGAVEFYHHPDIISTPYWQSIIASITATPTEAAQ